MWLESRLLPVGTYIMWGPTHSRPVPSLRPRRWLAAHAAVCTCLDLLSTGKGLLVNKRPQPAFKSPVPRGEYSAGFLATAISEFCPYVEGSADGLAFT